MTHKYYLSPDYNYLFKNRKQDSLFEVVGNSFITSNWHVGNNRYGGETAINMWKLNEISLEQTIVWLLNKENLIHILKEILQQYIDENYKIDLTK